VDDLAEFIVHATWWVLGLECYCSNVCNGSYSSLLFRSFTKTQILSNKKTVKSKSLIFSTSCGSILHSASPQMQISFKIIVMIENYLKLTLILSSIGLLFPPLAMGQSLTTNNSSTVEQPALNSTDKELSSSDPQQLAEATPTAEPTAAPASNQFSLTTKLQGQVIFGITGGLSGDISKNSVFGQRTRLELVTAVGTGTLTTRLQSTGLGQPNNAGAPFVSTAEGDSSFGGGPDNRIGLDLLKYEFPIGPNTQLMVAANAAGADDFTDSINPYFDGDGATGSVSRFGNRPSIYYLVSGTGAGIRHKFSDNWEGSLGYLATNANSPAVNNGLTAGGYGAIAQLTYKPSSNTKVGLTYVNAYNTTPATGSGNANPNGSNNMFGLQVSSLVSPGLALGGWIGYNKNSDVAGDRDIVNWAVTAAFPDLGAPGNLGGLLIGQEPRVTGATGAAIADSGSSLHLEGFYQIKVSDNISITPGLIYLTAPDHNSANAGALIGTIRTTFSF
jgi:Carbohydrate-selective porin, OprB family